MLSGEKATVLIVDDERSNLNILADILKPKYKVILAKNGQQALERAANQKPDLILLDIIMPEMDGYEVIYALKNNQELKDIPVIFISALSEDTDEENGLLLGAVDYIIKPFSPAIVMARVNSHIRIVKQIKLIESIALLDGLTGIPNRRNYDQRMGMEWTRAIREGTEISLLYLDIDHFKNYNDNYGHCQGDEALKAVAYAISRTLCRPGDFVARIGGEEFAVILPNTHREGALYIGELIRGAVEYMGLQHEYSPVADVLTVSIGQVTCRPDLDGTADNFMSSADKMLYRAKSEGRNRICSTDQEFGGSPGKKVNLRQFNLQ